MKRLKWWNRQRLAYKAARGVAKRRRRQPKIGLIQFAGQSEVAYLPNARLRPPSTFCISVNTEETLHFLKALRTALNAPPRRGYRSIASRFDPKRKRPNSPRWIGQYTDFRNIEWISPTAALIMASEYDRRRVMGQALFGVPPRLFLVDPHKWRPEVRATLTDVGFFEILGIDDSSGHPDAEHSILRFRSGDRSRPGEAAALLDDLQALFNSVNLNAGDQCFELNGPLLEAMENTVRCAYPENGEYEFQPIKRWWMTGVAIPSARRLQAAIFDQGVSIPWSLASSDWKFQEGIRQKIAQFLGFVPKLSDPSHDGLVISMAIEQSATSTNLAKHGKGLGVIRGFIDTCQNGRLTIMSRQGLYIYEKGRKPIIRNLPVNVGGTLVEWDVII